jgi:hypothetical protein
MIARRGTLRASLRRPSPARGLSVCLALLLPLPGGAENELPSEPRLFTTQLRLQPTIAQVAGLELGRMRWHLPPGVMEDIDSVLSSLGLPEEVRARLAGAVHHDRASGSAWIEPRPGLLQGASTEARMRWWGLLATHGDNRSHRWPLVLDAGQLEVIAARPEWAEAAARIRRAGFPLAGRRIFADLHLLADVLPEPAAEAALWQALLAQDGLFAKLQLDPAASPDDIAAEAGWWQQQGRYRAVEPLLRAIAHIRDRDRIDLLHLLPRLPRALLYTFPPNFAEAGDPAVENAFLAAAFFATAADPEPVRREGFSAWLKAHCEPAEGPPGYGDILVFGDPERSAWPYSLVYLADGLAIGRRPTFHGAWNLLRPEEIPLLNPRLGGAPPRLYRRKAPPEPPPVISARRFSAWELPLSAEPLAAGPWGELHAYPVLLAPPSELLAALPAPTSTPRWDFHGLSPAELRQATETTPMAAATREQLLRLLRDTPTEAGGVLRLSPSPELVRETPAAWRERTFPSLVHGSRAVDHAQDILIPTTRPIEEWFAPGHLPDAAREVLVGLSYRHGRGWMLSDFGTLYHSIDDPGTRLETLRALFRTPALIVLLKRPDPAAVDALADYWRLDPQKSLRAFLRAFAENEAMDFLDVTHLLPPLARELSGIYHLAASEGRVPSCYWSALNFAAERPEPSLLVSPSEIGREDETVRALLAESYDPIEAPGRIGDLVVYHRPATGELLHLCAYIAADVLFTKNGLGYNAPWCLMRKAKVDALYAIDDGVEIRFYREREFPVAKSVAPHPSRDAIVWP